QSSFETKLINATKGHNFPQNKTITLEINGAAVTGYFSGDTLVIQTALQPADELTSGIVVDPLDKRISARVSTRTKRSSADAGAPIKYRSSINGGQLADLLVDPPPQAVRYIIACQTQVTVAAVYAYRTVNNYKSISPVPAQYYRVVPVDFGD